MTQKLACWTQTTLDQNWGYLLVFLARHFTITVPRAVHMSTWAGNGDGQNNDLHSMDYPIGLP